MDYDRILRETYSWFSLDKFRWFFLFFCIGFLFLFLVPFALEINLFNLDFNWHIYSLYGVMFLTVLFGLMVFTSNFLNKKSIISLKISPKIFLDTIFIALVEMWYIFIWNLNESYRFTQLLLLAGIPLLGYALTLSFGIFVFMALCVFVAGYALIVLHNFLRISFSILIFYSNPQQDLVYVVKKSWFITKGKVNRLAYSYFLIFGSLIAIFWVTTSIVGLVLTFFLSNYFIFPVAYELSVMVASSFALVPVLFSYYSGFMELYFQLLKESNSKRIVDKILARKVLSETKQSVKKQKNKASKKKTTKKKPVKKTKKKLKQTTKKKSVETTTKKSTRKKPKKKTSKASKKRSSKSK